MGDETGAAFTRRQMMQLSASTLVAAQGVMAAGDALAQAATTTVERYLVTRLAQHNARKLFGVPGATCSPVFDAVLRSNEMSLVVTSSDLGAGYAADGYARLRGLAAVAVTYGVGTMSMLPAIAGAFVERSPVVVINGGPSAQDLKLQNELGSLFSHSTGRPESDLVMFREVTAFAARVQKAADAPKIVDRALTVARTRQRPVYLEIAKDVWGQSCAAPVGSLDVSVTPSGQETALAREIIAMLRQGRKPALLLGVELQRYGLTDPAVALVKKLGIPWATTLLGKSVIPEQTAGFVGVYGGEHAAPPVIEAVGKSDALLVLGCVMGRQYRRLMRDAQGRMALVSDGAVKIAGKPARPASLGALIAALQAESWTADPALIATSRPPGLSFDQRRGSLRPRGPSTEAGLGYDEVMRSISDALDESFITITDTSLSMYPAADLNVVGRGAFLCNGVWQSIGYSVGAAVGVGVAQGRRPLVICGDGGFQMTAQSLSTLVREGVRAIVIVLDNGLHGIEQYLLGRSYFANQAAQPTKYLALDRWNYAAMAGAMGFGFARNVDSRESFRQALADAKAHAGPALIAAAVKPHDLPAGLPIG